MTNRKPLLETYGRWRVLRRSGVKPTHAVAICECGTHALVQIGHLRSGASRSCGCLRDERTVARSTKHGLSPDGGPHKAYMVWAEAKGRCTRTTHKRYGDYGGRGITICERWREFRAFWEDMGPTYRLGLTLDRIDNSKGYSMSNCRWVSYRVQARNTRRNRRIETPNGPMLACEAAEVFGVKASRFYGKSPEAVRRLFKKILR